MFPVVGLDDAGKALVAWFQDDPDTSARSAWVAHYDGAAWAAPALLSNGTRNVNVIEMAMNATGDAIVAWGQDTNLYDSSQSGGGAIIPNIWAARYSGGAWSTPSLIGDSSLSGFDGCGKVKIATNASGDAVAIWDQSKNGTRAVTGNIYDATTDQWLSTPFSPINNTSVVAENPSVDIGDVGDIYVGWEQKDAGASLYTARVSRFDAAAGTWDDALQLSTTGFNIGYVLVQADGVGNGYVVWPESGYKMRRFNVGTGGESAGQQLQGGALDSDLVAAGNGHAALIYATVSYSTVPFTEGVWALNWQ